MFMQGNEYWCGGDGVVVGLRGVGEGWYVAYFHTICLTLPLICRRR